MYIEKDTAEKGSVLFVGGSFKFRFIGRDGPAANSLPTQAINLRILIVLDRYVFKFRFRLSALNSQPKK